MSRATVDALTYRQLLSSEFRRLRNRGYSADAATKKAVENISSAFISEDDATQFDFQKDHDDARANDWTA